jgi:hypothetical protein
MRHHRRVEKVGGLNSRHQVPGRDADQCSVMKPFFRLVPLVALCLLPACLKQVQTDEGSYAIPKSEKAFASGTRGVKLILSDLNGGSFYANPPLAIPNPAPIPVGPGSGSSVYSPGISARNYFKVDGTTPVAKPEWIHDVQLGVTDLPQTWLNNSNASPCASFGRYDSSSRPFDSVGFYRVSERDCNGYQGADNSSKVFIRVILNRDTAYLGTLENLMLQVEYQATGLRANSDGTDPDPEKNLDQLWKVFWGESLSPTLSFTPFSIMIPPNYADWCRNGFGPLSGSTCSQPNSSRVAPAVVRQVLIPLSSNPDPFVIQLQRIRGRSNSDMSYVQSFCPSSNSPLCLGVVFRSLTILRI